MKIFVSGSLAYDHIMDFPDYFKNHILPEKIHLINVSFTIRDLKENFGGTAGNIAYNLSLLEEYPVILATAGNDFAKYQDWLAKRNIDISKIKIIQETQTAAAYIMTDQADNQITAFHPGAMRFSAGIDEKIFSGEMPENNLAIVAPGNTENMVELARVYQKIKLPYIFDPGQAIPALGAEQLIDCLTGSKMLVSNDYELQLILEKTGMTEQQLFDKTETVVTTLGEKGSLIKTKGGIMEIKPAKPKNSSDPTGAGDAYRAGFIKGLASGYSLEKCGRLASVVSVYTVEKYGTQTHQFNWRELQKRYKDNYDEDLQIIEHEFNEFNK